MARIEQELLARMSTALQALDDRELDNPGTTFAACRQSINFDRLFGKAVADERYRRELAEAEAAKELTP